MLIQTYIYYTHLVIHTQLERNETFTKGRNFERVGFSASTPYEHLKNTSRIFFSGAESLKENGIHEDCF